MYKHPGRWNKQTRENCKRRGGKTDGETDPDKKIQRETETNKDRQKQTTAYKDNHK